MPVNARGIVFSAMTVLLVPLFLSDPSAAQVGPFMRGDRVREVVDTPAGTPTRRGMVVTVVAVPGDRITIGNDQLLVNQDSVEGFSTELVTMIARSKRVPERVANNQYLVMGEYTVADGSVVLKWGMYSAQDLEPATLDLR